VATRLLERKCVKYKDVSLLISEPRQSAGIETTQRVMSEAQQRTHTIKVTNVQPVISKEMLAMYFENYKRSHGAEIRDVSMIPEKKKAFISFNNADGMFFLYVAVILMSWWHSGYGIRLLIKAVLGLTLSRGTIK